MSEDVSGVITSEDKALDALQQLVLQSVTTGGAPASLLTHIWNKRMSPKDIDKTASLIVRSQSCELRRIKLSASCPEARP